MKGVVLRMLQTLRRYERLVRTLSYAELYSRVSLTLATTLRESGSKAGDALCIPCPGKGFVTLFAAPAYRRDGQRSHAAASATWRADFFALSRSASSLSACTPGCAAGPCCRRTSWAAATAKRSCCGCAPPDDRIAHHGLAALALRIRPDDPDAQ